MHWQYVISTNPPYAVLLESDSFIKVKLFQLDTKVDFNLLVSISFR